MCKKRLPTARLDPFYLFSSYPSEILTKNTNLYLINDVVPLNVRDLYKLKSIDYAILAIPSIEKIEMIYDIIIQKKSTNIEFLSSSINIDVNDIHKVVIWLLKFGYISLTEE